MSQGQRLVTGLVVTLVIAVVVVITVLQPFSSGKKPSAEPRLTDFYSAPAHLPTQPGSLIRSEAVFGGVPEGAQAWRILYTTTRSEGAPTIASALVIAKAGQTSSNHPVIAWAHATSGFVRGCAPSKQMDPTTFTGIPAVDQAVAKGWVIVATDYPGLGTKGPQPYLIGEGEARSVLDSVRAAHQFTKVSLADKTVVWGHSQGGGAALWAGIIAPDYAPDAHVVGVAAVAPTSDLPSVATNLGKVTGGVLFASYLMTSYVAAYPDVKFDHYVHADARGPMQDLAKHCLTETNELISIGQTVPKGNFYAVDPATGPLGARLAENDPIGKISVPVLIGQGNDDALVLRRTQDAYVANRCATDPGDPLEYKTYKGREHQTVIAADSPFPDDLMRWTTARFAARTAPSTCP